MKLKGFHNSIRRMAMVATCVVTVVSCSEAKFDDIAPEEPAATDKIVYLAVPELSLPKVSAATRIAIDNDDYDNKSLSLKWSDGDGFSLWAIAGGDEVPDFKNIEFEYVGPEKYPAGESRTLFASNSVPVSFLDGPYNGYSYTYTAFYPHQTDESKVDRTANRVTYEIPTLQNGRYDGKLDIMSAAPAAFSDALTPGVYQEIDLTFRHQTHALKITVPAGNNNFGADVTRLRIEFPQAVAGDLTFDARTGEVVDRSGLTENYVDIKFDKPLQEGEPFWVFIAPVEVSGEVKFTAYGGDNEKYQSEPSIAATGQFGSLEAEKITPVKLGIKPGFSITWFDYEVDYSQLGEEVEVLHLTITDGSQHFADGSTTLDVARDSEDGKFRFSFKTQELQNWDRVEIVPVYESVHAIVSEYAENLIIEKDYIPDNHNDRNTQAPYLFFENFDTVEGFSNKDSTDAGNGGDVSAILFLNDTWSGARIGASAGIGIRLAAHCRNFLGTYINPARLDSAPFSQLKDGAIVALSLEFDYGMNQASAGSLTSGQVNQTCYIGWHDQYNLLSTNTDGHFFDSFDINENDGNYNNLKYHYTSSSDTYLTGCSNTSRICIRTVPATPGGLSNRTCWLYLDNIKVSIVK